jgi:hypothetical protein
MTRGSCSGIEGEFRRGSDLRNGRSGFCHAQDRLCLVRMRSQIAMRFNVAKILLDGATGGWTWLIQVPGTSKMSSRCGQRIDVDVEVEVTACDASAGLDPWAVVQVDAMYADQAPD